MPCYLFIFHAYGTWMPDRAEGFVRRQRGLVPPNDDMAKSYKERIKEDAITFGGQIQALLIGEARIAGEKQHYRIHYVATDPTHIHVLASWPDERPWIKIRTGLKSSFTRRLNRDVRRRSDWFVDSASRKRVKDDIHFDHLVNEYLPSHRGWKWKEGGDLFL